MVNLKLCLLLIVDLLICYVQINKTIAVAQKNFGDVFVDQLVGDFIRLSQGDQRVF